MNAESLRKRIRDFVGQVSDSEMMGLVYQVSVDGKLVSGKVVDRGGELVIENSVGVLLTAEAMDIVGVAWCEPSVAVDTPTPTPTPTVQEPEPEEN